MSYDVGQYIDLTYLNKPKSDSSHQKKSSFQETAENLYSVGTQFIFQITPQGLKAAIRIPVATI